ncbi:hypothetical protein ACP275_02G191300 [Erythranthe tilingii]
MGEENEREPRTLKLPISAASTLSFMDSPEHPSAGTASPPLASVPFKWEELPGKPRPCSHNLARPEPKSLELPPMMMSRTPSPTSVLDGGGPYRPKCSSFRFFMDGHDSFLHSATSTPAGDGDDDDATLEYGSMFGSSKKKKKSSSRRYGFFGNKDKGVKKELNGGISGFSPFSTTTSSCESDESFNIMRRNSSFSSVPLPKSSSPITWATICSGFKQAIQWKSIKKSNKQGQD